MRHLLINSKPHLYLIVLVHRILHNKILNKNKVDVENLNNICIHISNKEKEAVKIERESIKLMQIKYLKKRRFNKRRSSIWLNREGNLY